MNQTIKDFIIIVLLLTLVLSKCGHEDKPLPLPQIIRDTTWIKKDSVINSRPQVIQTIPYPVDQISKEYIPDTNYAKLVKQYQEIVAKFLASNISEDSVRIDTFGYVKITDTVFQNMVQNRGIDYKLKLPHITKTVIMPPPAPKNQVYFGIGIQGNPSTLITQFNGNILFKNKKDQVLGIHAGISPTGTINYGLSTYWKIKL